MSAGSRKLVIEAFNVYLTYDAELLLLDYYFIINSGELIEG